ncbi:unnamed protein product [Peniophora sp. CBMAI 1063]|nr:unnamed protein product [Peniophora sp. CBMAI 1063]
MSGKDRVLNVDQAGVVASILCNEFLPIIRQNDPELSGFAVVRKWVSDRLTLLLSTHPLFLTDELTEARLLRVAANTHFRNFYHSLRVEDTSLGDSVLHYASTRVMRTRSVSRKAGSHTDRLSLPSPVVGENNVFISQGYKFKLKKRLQTSWYVHLKDYQDCGGCVIKPSKFNDRKEILLMTIIARDPEWLANQEDMAKYVIGRPRES